MADQPKIDEIRDAIKPEHFLGMGGSANVYALDGHPDKVVRVKHGADVEAALAHPPQAVDDPFQGRNFGQALTQYGEGVEIMMRQGGQECGLPMRFAGQDNAADIYKQSMADLAAAPVSAYVGFLEDVQFLETIGRRVDPKPSNLMVDSEAGRINIVDTANFGMNFAMHDSPAVILRSLFHYAGASEAGLSPLPEDVQANHATALDKMLEACAQTGMPFLHDKGGQYALQSMVSGMEPEKAAEVVGKVNMVNARAQMRAEKTDLPMYQVDAKDVCRSEAVAPPAQRNPSSSRGDDSHFL